MREEIRKLFPLEFYINNKGEMVSEISLKTLNKLSDEIIKLEEENERLKYREKFLEERLIESLSKNDKAIDFLEQIIENNGWLPIEKYDAKTLKNILQGSDKK